MVARRRLALVALMTLASACAETPEPDLQDAAIAFDATPPDAPEVDAFVTPDVGRPDAGPRFPGDWPDCHAKFSVPQPIASGEPFEVWFTDNLHWANVSLSAAPLAVTRLRTERFGRGTDRIWEFEVEDAADGELVLGFVAGAGAVAVAECTVTVGD